MYHNCANDNLQNMVTCQQRPAYLSLNNDHLGVPRVVVVHNFDCI
jgi:hypothetical protein